MFYPVLWGAQKALDPQFSLFVAPLHVINNRPLTSSKALGTQGGGFQQRNVLDFNINRSTSFISWSIISSCVGVQHILASVMSTSCFMLCFYNKVIFMDKKYITCPVSMHANVACLTHILLRICSCVVCKRW